jgi:hypothetical protein
LLLTNITLDFQLGQLTGRADHGLGAGGDGDRDSFVVSSEATHRACDHGLGAAGDGIDIDNDDDGDISISLSTVDLLHQHLCRYGFIQVLFF